MLALYLSLLTNEKDRADFEKLYRTYSNNVLKYAMSILHNQEFAEDVAHDVWLWVAEHFERFYSFNEINTVNYILKMVENRCNFLFRRDKTKRMIFDDVEFEILANMSSDEDVLLSFCEKEECQMIIDAINSLDAIYRDVLNLYYLNENTTKEISAILKINDSTARQRLARGRRLLIEQLEKKGVYYES